MTRIERTPESWISWGAVGALALGLLVSAAAFVPASAEDPAPAESGFRRLRAPLLGYAVERDAASDRYRLVAESPARVVCEGTLDECESKLLDELKREHGTGFTTWRLPTFGGKQFWADRVLLAGWRVQENVYTGHCRLLNADDEREAWGSFEACRVVLEEKRQRLGLRPRSEHLVVMLHGMIRSKDSFAKLAKAIEAAGYEVANVNYPSTRRRIRDHALQIDGILDTTEGVTKVSFVTHSLGGVVVRDLLSLDSPWRKRIELGRVVMLGPPNQGSIAAEALKEWLPYEVVMGKVGQELTADTVTKLPPPPCEFGVIAGGTKGGEGAGYNPLLPGDDDGVVTVANTRLEGAADFIVIKATHTFMMRNDEVRAAVLSFLEHGRFAAKSASAPAGSR